MNLRRLATKRNLALGGVVLAVAAGTGAALAASSTVFDPKAERDAFQAAVAKKLGVTTKQLQEAYKAAALERLDAAVAAGRITKEQAEAIRSRIESGELAGPMGFGFMGPGMHARGFFGHVDHLSAAADYLGLTEAQLRAKLSAGSSLADVTKAEGKSVDGLKQAMLAAAKAKLDDAVKDGRITTAQRDQALTRLESMLDDIVEGTIPSTFRHRFDHGFAPGFGIGPGFGHRFDHGYEDSSDI